MSLPFLERTKGTVQISSNHPGERRMVLSVVIPCMNEAEVLQETNRRLVAVLEGISLNFEIVYVDDGSTDFTPELLRELQAQDSRVRVVRFSRNFGQSRSSTLISRTRRKSSSISWPSGWMGLTWSMGFARSATEKRHLSFGPQRFSTASSVTFRIRAFLWTRAIFD